MTTWSISFQEIERVSLASAALLRLCAFLEPEFIPEELVLDGLKQLENHFGQKDSGNKSDLNNNDQLLSHASLYENLNDTINISQLGRELQKQSYDPIALNDMIGNLLRFSLIKRHNDTKAFSIHRLVQVVLIDRVPEEIRFLWAMIVLEIVNLRLPRTVRSETWIQCDRYFSQAQACINLVNEYYGLFVYFKSPAMQAARFFNTMGNYLHEQVHYKQARPFFEAALQLYELAEGQDSLDAAIVWHQLARLSFVEGKYDEAEALFQRTIDFYHQCPRVVDRIGDALMTFHEWARLSIAQKKFSKAQQLITYTLKMRKILLGEEHRDTAATMHELAILYQKQENYEQAIRVFRDTLRIEEKVLGYGHFDVAITLNNLGETYFFLYDYEEAKKCFERALVIFMSTNSDDLVHIPETLSHLAMTNEHQNHLEDAIYFYKLQYQECFKLENDIYDDAYKIALMSKIAELYTNLDMIEEAKNISYEILCIEESNFNKYKTQYFGTLYFLAMLYQFKNEFEYSQTFYLKAVNLLDNQQIEDNCEVAVFLMDFSNLYRRINQEAKALPLVERAIGIYIRELGLEHSDTQSALELYGLLKHNLQNKKAIPSKRKIKQNKNTHSKKRKH